MSPHPSSTRLRAVAAWGFVIVSLCTLLSLFLGHGDVSDGARLRLTSPLFDSSSRFELLFAADMVPAETVGSVAVESPLHVEPMLKGAFVWLSPRHGVYEPQETPRLNTTYRFRLATGLRDASGRRTNARLDRELTTPAFDLANARTSFRSFTNNPSLPVMHAAFNEFVDPAALVPYCEFRSSGARMEAKVTAFAERQLPGYRVAGNPGVKSRRVTDAWSQGSRSEIRNAVRIEPATRLPAADDWRLVLRAGLPTHDAAHRLANDRVIRIGHVPGMSVREIFPANSYLTGRGITANLTANPDGTPSPDWMSVAPQPANLRMERGYRSVSLRGDFELDRDYHVTVHAGLRNWRGDRLEHAVTSTIRFQPLPPRVILSAEDEIQYAGGEGRFEFLAYNTERVRLRAKRILPDDLIHVLKGYRDRVRNPANERDYPFDLVPGGPGTTRHLNTRSPTDVPTRAVVDLKNLAGSRGALFLDLQPTAEGGHVGAQALGQVTDLGALWKRATKSWQVQVFSMRTGNPVSGADVALVTDDNQTLATGRCDRDGRVKLPARSDARWLRVTRANDAVALPLHAGRIYRSGVPTSWRPVDSPEARMFLFTDRPVYEPGDEVRLKGILRVLDDRLTVPPADMPVEVTLFDSRGSAIVRTNLALSTAGSFNWVFAAPDRHRGRHRLTVRWQDQEAETPFLVQDYEPDAFEVRLGGASEFAAGEPIQILASARYLFGTALSAARGRWVAEAEAFTFTSDALPGFVFGEHVGNHRLRHDPERAHVKGEFQLTNVDPATVSFRLPPARQPRRVNVEAEVTDLNQQTITAGKQVIAHAAQFYLGVSPPPRRPKAGEAPILKVAAATPDGALIKRPLTCAQRLDLVRWRSHRVAGTGGSIDYRHDWKLVEVATNQVALTEITDLALPVLPEAGEYLLTLSARDESGREVETRLTFHASGTDAVTWDYRNTAETKLTPDRENYQPGDTAELLVESPIDGTAYVSIERERVHYSFTTNISGGAPIIRIPLRREDAPNVFASVTVIRGGKDSPLQHPAPEFRHGYAQLKVAEPATLLDVELTLDRAEYRPGQNVRVTGVVKNHRGRPARDAEVTLYAVDEGVLQLTGESGPRPHDFFHAERPLAVQPHLSLSELLSENPADLRFHNKGYVIGGGGRLPGVRQEFSAVPLWRPALRTDRRGRVSAEFRAPDNLTRYRVIAIAHHRADRFGHAEATVVVNKPLVVEPILPAFARVGDHIECRALIVNRTSAAGQVLVTRDPGNHSQRLALAAGEAKTVTFPTTFTNAGPVEWTLSARFLDPARADDRDAVARSVNVAEAMPRRREIAVGRVTGTTNLFASMERALLSRPDTTAELLLAPSPLLETHAGIEYLLQYPYGCAEQTASSLLPWLLVADSPGLAQLIGKTGEEIAIATEAGIRRLFSMQTSEGGLSYWPGGREAMFWAGAYAAFVLSHAESPPPTEWRALLGYLRKGLLAIDPIARTAFDQSHGLALYALARAGEPLPELHRRIHERRATLDGTTRALVALAETCSEGRRELARDLLSAGEAAEGDHYFGSRHRRLAIEAMAWRALDATAADAKLRELLAARNNGHWFTTQGNAWTLLAVADRGAPATRTTSSGTLDGKPFSLPPGETLKRAIKLGGLNASALSLTVDQPVYAHLRVSTPLPPDAPPEAGRGFAITRKYERLNGPGAWRVGDSILVTLTLKSEDGANHVAIDDPLPALLEAVVPEFRSRAVAGDPPNARWHSSYRELRRDRALFFRDRLPSGTHVIRYVARVRAAGKAIAPPTKVERMYAPDRFGTGATQHVEATP